MDETEWVGLRKANLSVRLLGGGRLRGGGDVAAQMPGIRNALQEMPRPCTDPVGDKMLLPKVTSDNLFSDEESHLWPMPRLVLGREKHVAFRPQRECVRIR